MDSAKQFLVQWVGRGYEPQHKPNPAYPNGIALDIAGAAEQSCVCELPYPAARCGNYVIGCKLCGIKVMCSTAGRHDDPRSIKLPCQPMSARA